MPCCQRHAKITHGEERTPIPTIMFGYSSNCSENKSCHTRTLCALSFFAAVLGGSSPVLEYSTQWFTGLHKAQAWTQSKIFVMNWSSYWIDCRLMVIRLLHHPMTQKTFSSVCLIPMFTALVKCVCNMCLEAPLRSCIMLKIWRQSLQDCKNV